MSIVKGALLFGDLVFFQLSLLIDRLGIQIFSTSTVQLVTIPAITPRAASQGARANVSKAPVATQVTEIYKSTSALFILDDDSCDFGVAYYFLDIADKSFS